MKLLLICLSIFFIFRILHSQQDIKYKHIQVHDGLSQSWVKCIYQDSYGFLWFGTAEGINKFDGANFQIYKHDPANKYSLSNNLVNVIFEDSRGNLWVGTQSGINILNREKDQFDRYPALQSEYINDFVELNDGRIVIAHNSGLYLMTDLEAPVVKGDQLDSLIKTFPLISANNILLDKQDNLWIATFEGLYFIGKDAANIINVRPDIKNPGSYSGNAIHTIYQDLNGRIWLGTFESGLLLLKLDPDKPVHEAGVHVFAHNPHDKKSIGKGAVYSILDDSEGNLWIGTENGGLNVIKFEDLNENHVKFNHYLHNPADKSSISSNSIYSIFKDKEGTIWIGTYGGGLNYYNKNFARFYHYQHIPNEKNSLSSNKINVIHEEEDLLWIGTEKGLNILNKKTGRVETYYHNSYDDHSISSNSVLAICRDKKNLMWIGTWAGGLNLFNENSKTFTRYKYDENDDTSLGSNNIFDIMCDRDGDLWIATMGGGLNLYNYETQDFRRFKTDFQEENTISDNWVECLLEVSSGEIWISTTTAVDIFDKHNQKFITFRHDASDPKSINYNGAIVLYEDSNKNIWAGTESGLNLFNREDSTFSFYQESDGLPNNTIKGICEDNAGNLWLSTNYGLSKFINGINHPKEAKFKNYIISDGLQGNEFNSRCACIGHDGILYFGGNNGFNAFKPEDIVQNPEILKVVLTNFLIFNKPVEIGGKDSPLQKHISLCEELRLNYNYSVFTIEYAAINYLTPDKNRYAFMLEGFEDDWNYVGNQRLATYTNLDAGEYRFRVKATSNDEIWYEQDKSIRIIIIPPWWESYWAYLSYLILVISLLYLIWRFQLNKARIKHELILEQQHAEKLEELNLMKSRFFSNITHEFRTPLTLIMGPVKQFLTDGIQSNFTEKCQMILRNSEKLYHLINQLLELNKLEAGFIKLEAREVNIIPLLEKIIKSFSSLMDSEKINFTYSVIRDPKDTNTPLNIYINPDKFEKVINNLLSNAIKFTPEQGHIDIILKDSVADKNEPKLEKGKNELIEIIVKDSGRGIPESDLKRIFDRFYQVDNTRYSGYVGTGIGLSLVKELVELHHGMITAESTNGNGTAFIIRLLKGHKHLESGEILQQPQQVGENNDHLFLDHFDIRKETDSNFIKNAKNTISKTKHQILIIEDNPDLLKYLSDCLSKKYQVIEAQNGVEGFQKAIKYIPDLIVSDVVMPNMDGLAFCDTIKKDERTSQIPVIFLTARASNESKIVGLETGADDYISKPFEIKELEVRIHNLIDQRMHLVEKFKRKAGLKPQEITTSSLDKKFLEKALAKIENNISDPNFGVEEFAAEMALSRVQLYRKIRALTGQTASEFIRTVRMNRAAQLLRQKHDNIGQIAFDVGFNNPSYFSKCFYKQFGIYPSNYIK